MNIYIAYLFGFIGFLAASFKLYGSLSNRKPKIVFFFDEVIDLYKSTINIKNLEGIYNGLPIKKNLFLLNYIFIYSGKKDILQNDFNKGIELALKGEGEILPHNVTLNPSNIKLLFENTTNKFSLKADLLKDEDFFTGEILVEYNGRIEDPTKILNINSRIINVDTPKLYDYRHVKIQNEMPIFDWVTIFTGPVMAIIMLFSVYSLTNSNLAIKKFSKDGVFLNIDSLNTEINSRLSAYNILKEINIKHPALDSLRNVDLKITKTIEISNEISPFK
ncbi:MULTISPECIES: hypothetical protein [unclassified Spirosoma]|uniref:hypothetical protein n=1 Tax=unclassified Spirosoma TaxID=2621999 RepID=UPI000964E1C0|nr:MULTISPECIES: hypothetical protein [unclassified Spirosoma]MBN8826315.1 hypothetical protein [Spirosoma sp.]OJW75210.1 MAG: hypothetical protein BGO59_18130 [Spirosoma sp. 48-14]